MELLKERRGTHALGLAQQVAMERGKERQVQHVVELVLPAAMLMPLPRQGRQRMTASLVRQVAMERQVDKAQCAATNSFARQTNLRMAYAWRALATRSPPLARLSWMPACVLQTASTDICSPRTRAPQVWKGSAYRAHNVRPRTLPACC
jgi:hypothetical protein